MGIDLIFRGDGHESSTRFSMAELDMLSLLEPLLPGPVAKVFGGARSEMGVEEEFAVNDLLEDIDRIDDFLSNRPDLLPETYTYKPEYLLSRDGSRYPIDQDFVTGSMSGLELPGDPAHRYSMHAGVGSCSLTKIAIGPDGRGKVVERRDLRGEPYIETITCGRIEICKRTDHAGLLWELARIREFLASLAGSTVTRMISG